MPNHWSRITLLATLATTPEQINQKRADLVAFFGNSASQTHRPTIDQLLESPTAGTIINQRPSIDTKNQHLMALN